MRLSCLLAERVDEFVSDLEVRVVKGYRNGGSYWRFTFAESQVEIRLVFEGRSSTLSATFEIGITDSLSAERVMVHISDELSTKDVPIRVCRRPVSLTHQKVYLQFVCDSSLVDPEFPIMPLITGIELSQKFREDLDLQIELAA